MEPLVSLIIPVKNGADTLRECLYYLKDSEYKNIEIVVVDDHSEDASVEIAVGAEVNVLRLEGARGVSAARNHGAWHAHGHILLFTDADVMFPPEAVGHLVRCFDDAAVDAAVGLFERNGAFSNACSRWKNLWLRYTYERLPDRIALFFTSVAAARTEVFRESGGFDERYETPSVEDTELGRRLAARGRNIALCRDARVIHHKRYSCASLMATDFARAAALVRLALRERARGKRTGSKFSVPFSYPAGAGMFTLGLLFFIISLFPIQGAFAAAGLALCLGGFMSALPFISYFIKQNGFTALPAALLIYAADAVALTCGALWGIASFGAGRKY